MREYFEGKNIPRVILVREGRSNTPYRIVRPEEFCRDLPTNLSRLPDQKVVEELLEKYGEEMAYEEFEKGNFKSIGGRHSTDCGYQLFAAPARA